MLMGLYLLFVLVVLLIMFRGRGDSNSIFDRVYRLVCVHLPNGIKSVARLLCGERGPRALDATWEYIAWSNNPLVQMFYIAVVTFAYCAYTIYLYPFMPNTYLAGYEIIQKMFSDFVILKLSSACPSQNIIWLEFPCRYHSNIKKCFQICRWHRHVGFANFLVCVFSWYMSSIKDPGVVTDWNVEGLCKQYVDSVIYTQCEVTKVLHRLVTKKCFQFWFCLVELRVGEPVVRQD